MTQYPLDVAAEQVVRWLMQEITDTGREWRIRATREYVRDGDADLATFGLSSEADVASLITVGALEAELPGEHPAWRLRIRMEDVVGPHTPEDESVPDGAEEIDLETFEADFVLPDRGTAYVNVEAETEDGLRHFNRLYGQLIRDRHRD